MATTAGIKLKFSGNGKTWTKTLNGMNADKVSDTTVAASFADDYKEVVSGTLEAAEYTRTEPVDIDG